MRYVLISLGLLWLNQPLALAQNAPIEAECEIQTPSPEVQKSVDRWLGSFLETRSDQHQLELTALLERPNNTCRDIIALERVSYIFDMRDKTSETASESAEFILKNPDRFMIRDHSEAIRFLIRYYKANQNYAELVTLWNNPVVRSNAGTIRSARNAFVLAVFALVGEQKTLEILTPLVDEPVSGRDWWLMHFAHAVALRAGDSDLADRFQQKADSIFVPDRPFDFPQDVTGDKADKMLALSTREMKEQNKGWGVTTPPIPTYPFRAAQRGVTGYCDVVFDVSPDGRPENVKAYCTSKLFLREAVRAVRSARLEHPAENPPTATGILYPLEFDLEG